MTVTRQLIQQRSSGVTIVELTVALMLTAVLTGIVYTTWNHITLSTEVQKRRTVLKSESGRVINQIATQLRNADGMLLIESDEIEFTGNNGEDTIHYVFDGSELLCNDNPVNLLRKSINIADFSVHDDNGNDERMPYLITIALTLREASGDTARSAATIFVRRQRTQSSDNTIEW